MSQILEWLIGWIASSQEYFRQLGWGGILVYAGLIVAVQAALLPVSPLAMAAGVIFGLGGGYAAVEIGTGVGVVLNFLLSRYLVRDWVTRKFASHEKFRLIDSAIGREGGKIVFLLRFCPIPFGLANFLFGLTAVRFVAYTVASILAIAGPNFFFVYLGATAGASLQALVGAGRPRHPMEYVLLGLGMVAGFVALTIIGRIARTAVAKGETAPETP